MAGNTTGTGSTPTANEPTGIMGAASVFEQLLTLEEGNQGEHEAGDEEAGKANESQALDDDADDADSDGEQSGEQDENTQQPDGPAFTVFVDGKEVQVTADEAKNGYLRHADYTRKTQEVAHSRKEVAQLREQIRAQEAEYAALLPKLRSALEADLREPNWEELRAADPANAAVEFQRFQERRARIEGIRAEEQRLAAEQERQFAEERNRILIEERDRLLNRPELAHWRDPAKAESDTNDIVAVMREAGFGDNELQIYDHRAMVIAWMAAQYKKSLGQRNAARESVQQKITKAPVTKPGNGGVNAPSTFVKASNRLAKSGSVRDAAAVFEHFL